jgi:hypothetical protein
MARNGTAVRFNSGRRPGTRSGALPVSSRNLARVQREAVGASTDGTIGTSFLCRSNPRRGSHARGRSITPRSTRRTPASRGLRAQAARRGARALALRYTDTGKDPNGERPRLKHPDCLSSPSLSAWVGRGRPRSRAALHNLGFVQQAARAGAFRARQLAGPPARSGSGVSHPTAEPSQVGALCLGLALSGDAASDPLAVGWGSQRREQS